MMGRRSFGPGGVRGPRQAFESMPMRERCHHRTDEGEMDVQQRANTGRADDRLRAKGFGGALALMLALSGVAGCARVSTEDVNVRATGLPRPQQIVVHDFGVSPAAVSLDTAPGARLMEMAKGTPEAQEQTKVGTEVARIVTQNLVKEIGALGIPAVAAANAVPVAGPSLAIEGQFMSVDEG